MRVYNIHLKKSWQTPHTQWPTSRLQVSVCPFSYNQLSMGLTEVNKQMFPTNRILQRSEEYTSYTPPSLTQS